jgi:hypothetical protein
MSPLAERYYRSWLRSQSVDGLERFLARYPGLNIVQLVKALLVDQVLESQRGPVPSVEQYLQRFPIVSDHRLVVAELNLG